MAGVLGVARAVVPFWERERVLKRMLVSTWMEDEVTRTYLTDTSAGLGFLEAGESASGEAGRALGLVGTAREGDEV